MQFIFSKSVYSILCVNSFLDFHPDFGILFLLSYSFLILNVPSLFSGIYYLLQDAKELDNKESLQF